MVSTFGCGCRAVEKKGSHLSIDENHLSLRFGRARLQGVTRMNSLQDIQNMSRISTRTEEQHPYPSPIHTLPRRDFLKMVASATVASALWKPLEADAGTKLEPLAPGIKVSLQISTDATDDDLRFAQQLGVAYVNIPTG